MNTQKLLLGIAMIFLVSISFVSAVTVTDVQTGKFFPGETTSVIIDVKNILDDDVEDVSLVLELSDTGFITSGSSEDSEDEIDEGDEESFRFTLKAPSGLAPGDYNIPYTITYSISGEDERIERNGSFGITVSAETELSFGVELEKNVVDEQGKLSFKIVNSGLGDIGFVYVKVVSSNGFEILSTNEEYIGEVDSDDFEFATFDVLFQRETASITVQVEYKDFDNNNQVETITLPIKVYSKERALELGIIKKNNTPATIGIVIALILIWIIYRKVRKAKKKKRQQERA